MGNNLKYPVLSSLVALNFIMGKGFGVRILAFETLSWSDTILWSMLAAGNSYTEKNMDEMESNEAKLSNSQNWYSSPTLQKVAYSAFLHILSGAIYGSYSIYLNISKPTIDETHFFIAFGCYVRGTGLYMICVSVYSKVLIFFKSFFLLSFLFFFL